MTDQTARYVTVLNAWAVVFGLDAVLTLLGALTGLDTWAPFAWPKGLLGMAVLLGALIVWMAWILSPRVPARVALPGPVFVLWTMLGLSPFLVWYALTPWFTTIVGLLQTLAAAITLGGMYSIGARPWLTEAHLTGRRQGSILRTGGLAVAHLVGMPIAILLYAFGTASLALSFITGGYMALDTSGLHAAHRTFVNDDHALHLIGMIHIGEEEGYKQLFEDIPSEGTILLAEGVTDRESRLKQGISYANVAKSIGVQMQPPPKDMTGLEVQQADVDVSSFSDNTLTLLGLVGAINASDDPVSAIQDYMAWINGQEDPNTVIWSVYDDIVHARNMHLMSKVDEAFDTYDRVVVPWGAVHMFEVAQEVDARGFQQVDEQWVTLITF